MTEESLPAPSEHKATLSDPSEQTERRRAEGGHRKRKRAEGIAEEAGHEQDMSVKAKEMQSAEGIPEAVLSQTDDAEKKTEYEEIKGKMAEARRILGECPGITTVSACCLLAGFETTDRIAVENKDFIEQLHAEYGIRQQVRTEVWDSLLSVNVGRDVAHALGSHFETRDFCEGERLKRTVALRIVVKNTQESTLERWGVGVSSQRSTCPTAVSTEMLHWLMCSCAHAVYDLRPKDYQDYFNRLRQMCADDVRVTTSFQKYLMWLKRSKHCRYAWDFSDMSMNVINKTRSLGQCANAVTFLGSIYFGRNNRDSVDEFFVGCSCKGADLLSLIWKMVNKSYPADMKRCPVSAATAMTGLKRGDNTDTVTYRTSILAAISTHALLGAFAKDPSVMTDYKEIKRATN